MEKKRELAKMGREKEGEGREGEAVKKVENERGRKREGERGETGEGRKE